jgi:tetratricopeptide (TPR) repeat protein
MSMSAVELRTAVAAGWASAQPDEPSPTVDYFVALLEANPASPIAAYNCARAHDFSGHAERALPLYEQAFAAGLDGDDLRGAFARRGSTLRNLGRFHEAVELLGAGLWTFPGDPLIRCYLALAMHSAGSSAAAVAQLIDLIVDQSTDPDVVAGARPLRNYAAMLRNGYWTPDGGASTLPAAA